MNEDWIVKEEDSTEFLENKVRPWIRENLKEQMITSADGTWIHACFLKNSEEKGSVMIAHGFCEFFGKYHEVSWLFYQMGYSVYFAEMRGHGKSQRFVKEKDRVYVENFDEYVEDLEALYTQILDTHSPKEHRYLFAHSMGGCVGALLLEKHPDWFEKAVLSSPMLELNYGKHSVGEIRALSIGSRILHWNDRLTPGASGWTGKNVFETSSCLSRARYDYQFHQREEDDDYKTWSATYAWTRAAQKGMDKALKNAEKVNVPVLLFQAGQDAMVKSGGQTSFAEKSKNTEIIRFGTSRHEIFNATYEIRKTYWKDIEQFLSK